MDPVSVIVAAVVAGAASGLGDSVKAEVAGAYAALRAALRERFSDRPVVTAPLDRLERKPDRSGRREALHAGLSEVGAADDVALVGLAEAVLDKAGVTAENVLRVSSDAVVKDVVQENAVMGTGARNEARIGRRAHVEGVHQINRSD
jgi:hypothetical protein